MTQTWLSGDKASLFSDFLEILLEELKDSDWEPEPEHAEDEEGEGVGDDRQANMAQTVGERLEKQNRKKAQTLSDSKKEGELITLDNVAFQKD